MRRLLVAGVGFALVALLPSASVAGTVAPTNRAMAEMWIAPYGETVAIGTVKTDVRDVLPGEVPGLYAFDGVSGNPVSHTRGVVQQVTFWPWYDDSQDEWANWAWLEGHQCVYFANGDPSACVDISWALIDYHSAAATDMQIVCRWESGVRPGFGWEYCDPDIHPEAGILREWQQVVKGTLVVLMAG